MRKPLGIPKKVSLNASQKRKRKPKRNQRKHIEGEFGQAKNAYGLRSIKTKRSDAGESCIGTIFFVINLIKLQKNSNTICYFFGLI